MIECENCILEKAVHVCEVDCLALEDALREHDKQIRESVIDECKDILCCVNWKVISSIVDIDKFIKDILEHLKENK